MKKIVLLVSIFLSLATYAQKDELKILKKIYDKEKLTETDLVDYKAASEKLNGLAQEESDKVYAKFYQTMFPTLEIAMKGSKATLNDLMKVYQPEFLKNYGAIIDEVIAFEKKSGKKIYTDDLILEKKDFRTMLANTANSLNDASNFKDASRMYYALYIFDPKNEGKSLQNASILAVNSQDFPLALKLYEELKNSDYFKNGIIFKAINKASGNEEELSSREERSKLIAMDLYEKPKDVKVSDSKSEVLKIIALLNSQLGDIEKTKVAYSEARELLPEDEELIKGEFNIYFNQGIAKLAEDDNLVKEINASLDNIKKYDELNAKRKELFKSILPYFEKAYSLIPTDVNTKNVLKLSYEILGMKDKLKELE